MIIGGNFQYLFYCGPIWILIFVALPLDFLMIFIAIFLDSVFDQNPTNSNQNLEIGINWTYIIWFLVLREVREV